MIFFSSIIIWQDGSVTDQAEYKDHLFGRAVEINFSFHVGLSSARSLLNAARR